MDRMANKPVKHALDHAWGGVDEVADGPRIYVGTPGVDGVDALIAANQPPYNNTTGCVPFTTGTDALGDFEPVNFYFAVGGKVRIDGVPTGVTGGDELFTLPAAFRPPYRRDFRTPGPTGGSVASWTVNTDGTVVYGGST